MYSFTFFVLLSSSLSPCLSQRFGRCMLRPSSGVWNVELSSSSTNHVYWMSVISYLLLISPLKVLHCLHRVLNSHSFGYVTGSNHRLYPLCYVSLKGFVYEFQGIIKLMSSANIFTSAHIAILLLSLHVFCLFVFYQKSYRNFVIIALLMCWLDPLTYPKGVG